MPSIDFDSFALVVDHLFSKEAIPLATVCKALHPVVVCKMLSSITFYYKPRRWKEDRTDRTTSFWRTLPNAFDDTRSNCGRSLMDDLFYVAALG